MRTQSLPVLSPSERSAKNVLSAINKFENKKKTLMEVRIFNIILLELHYKLIMTQDILKKWTIHRVNIREHTPQILFFILI